MSTFVCQLNAISRREIRLLRKLEAEVYPKAFRLGKTLLDDADLALSICVMEDKRMAGYCIVERVSVDTVYIADIVRHPQADVRAGQMLQMVLVEVQKDTRIKYITADCRQTSLHLIRQFPVRILDEEPWWDDDREEQMVSFRLAI